MFYSVLNQATYIRALFKMSGLLSALKLHQNCLKALFLWLCLMVIYVTVIHTFTNLYFNSVPGYKWFNLQSCVGNIPIYACSGTAISCQEGSGTIFLTSASLVRAFYDTEEIYDNLKVGAASHPLLIFACLLRIFVTCFLLCHYRLKCAMKAMKCTRVIWQNMI